MTFLLRTALAAYAFCVTDVASAAVGMANSDYKLPVGGTTSSVLDIIDGLAELLVRGAVPVCITIMIVGGLMMAASHGNESWAENGKKAIMGGLIGFCVVMGSYGILRMLFGFIYL